MVAPHLKLLLYYLFARGIHAILPISTFTCAESSNKTGSVDNVRYFLVATSRSLHALEVDKPVLFLFQRVTEKREQSDSIDSTGQEICNRKALVLATKELLGATQLYGGEGRVHIPFFDNQTSYSKLIIRQENVKLTKGVWQPGQWSQEVIVESMEWKPSYFLFRCVHTCVMHASMNV